MDAANRDCEGVGGKEFKDVLTLEANVLPDSSCVAFRVLRSLSSRIREADYSLPAASRRRRELRVERRRSQSILRIHRARVEGRDNGNTVDETRLHSDALRSAWAQLQAVHSRRLCDSPQPNRTVLHHQRLYATFS